jgi:hypothetical protein
LAKLYGPKESRATSVDFRTAALEIRKRSMGACKAAARELQKWLNEHQKLPQLWLSESLWHMEFSGVYLLYAGDSAIYVNESNNMRRQIEAILANEHWHKLQVDRVKFVAMEGTQASRYKVKAMLAKHEGSLMNCPLLIRSV